LDAGSGPIQYPAYLEYSAGFEYRVCVDISRRALREARDRIGGHGLFVQADMSLLPFRKGSFDAAVSMHALHHLPVDSQVRGVHELVRTLAPGGPAVVVNGWGTSPLMVLLHPLILLSDFLRRLVRDRPSQERRRAPHTPETVTGTRVERVGWAWWRARAKEGVQIRIVSWRSLSVRCLRALIHPRLGGERILRGVEGLEDHFPRMLGRLGQYPLVVLRAG
jgi:SAM-dependent methyltransferase